MKFKSILMAVLVACLLVCLCACGGNTADTNTDTNTTASTTTTTTTATTTTTTTTTTASNKVTYVITVVDEAGNPIPGAFPQMCLTSCMPRMTNEQGVATFANMDKANYDVKFMSVPEGYVLPVDENGELIVYHFEEGSYELTLVLKAVA